MGYTTDFEGSFTVEPPLNESEINYLKDFAETRRMSRANGPYFVKGEGSFGQGEGPDEIYNYNNPPEGQPGLWCQWVSTEDGKEIQWDGGEKFYNSPEWLKYLIDHFLSAEAEHGDMEVLLKADDRFANFTFDHVVNGIVEAQGEDPGDRWQLVVKNNEVKVVTYKMVPDREYEV